MRHAGQAKHHAMTLKLSDNLWDRLTAQSERTRIPKTALIEQGLEIRLQRLEGKPEDE
jgi:predicted transcriptional regulator